MNSVRQAVEHLGQLDSTVTGWDYRLGLALPSEQRRRAKDAHRAEVSSSNATSRSALRRSPSMSALCTTRLADCRSVRPWLIRLFHGHSTEKKLWAQTQQYSAWQWIL